MFTLQHYRTLFVSVFVAALLISLAASSSPFVTSAVASESLKDRLAELNAYATGLDISGGLLGYGLTLDQALKQADAREAAVWQLQERLPHVQSPVLTVESGQLDISGRTADTQVRLMARNGFPAHVKILSRVSGEGVWISNLTADQSGLKAGGTLTIRDFAGGPAFPSSSGHMSNRLRVVGIYRALPYSPLTPYWTNLFDDAWAQSEDASPPPTYVFLPRNELYRLAVTGGGSVTTMAELPIDPKGMTLPEARSLVARFTAIARALPRSSLGQKLGCEPSSYTANQCKTYSSLLPAVILADRSASAVSPAVTLLSDVGGGIALAVAAAAGAFLVRRRRAEAALLYARGVRTRTFAGQGLLEALIPTLLGGGAGFGLAYVLTGVFAPSGSLDPATVYSGIAHAAGAVAVGLLLLVGAAVVSFLHLYDTGLRGVRWLRFVPWELPLLGVALYLLVAISSGSGLSNGHPTLSVFLFPLLLVAGVAGIFVRFARFALSHAPGSRATPAVYFALRRLAAARGLLVVLAVVSAASLGSFFYAETLAASLHKSTTEKAYMATGSDAQATVSGSTLLPPNFPYPITKLEFGNQAASIGSPTGDSVDVMVVTPSSFVQTLRWQSGWGPNPSNTLRKLATEAPWPLPVVVTRDFPPTAKAISMQGVRVPIRVLARIDAFPLEAVSIPLLVTSFRALNGAAHHAHLYDPIGVPWTYVLAKGPPDAVVHALTVTPSLGVYYPASVETYLRDPNVTLATRTYAFMRTIAIAGAVLVFVGLLLYLQARQRAQVISSTLARRMGLGTTAETFSLCLELGAILLFAGGIGGGVAVMAATPIVHHLDPLPQDAPTPILSVPTVEFVVVAAALVAVAVIAGLVTSWLARRANVAEALRVA
jgi:putative ABC transport system permease protein